METQIKIQTKDKKFIYGTFAPSTKKLNQLVIFVHGFTGHQHEHIFFNGAKLFSQKGFDTFRFNLYDGDHKDARKFSDTKISLHGEDITTVVKYFRKKYKRIFLVGHSYGGTSLLFIDQSAVDGLVFWDAGYIDSTDATDHIRYNKCLDAYILEWGTEIIAGKKFIAELKNFPDCGKLIKNIKKPVLFITAGKIAKQGEKYYKHANNPKKLIKMKLADHCFNSWKQEDLLLENTLNWLKSVK